MSHMNNRLLLASAITLILGNSPVLAEDAARINKQSESVVNARQEAQIWTTYALSPYLRAHDLSVSVQDGKATLTGNVDEELHRRYQGHADKRQLDYH
ncbi:BON domain-containing protein [Rheinheimera fenheensis]|uniref:BON domain-containing protein n=1 Tax=Rheinheimera fenheensis TaxID=3152295 RepID=UPI0032618DF7